MTDEEKFAEARRHAQSKFDFYVHLAVYLAVIVALFIINLTTGLEYLWFVWPAMGWGIAVLIHGANAFLLIQKKEQIIDSLARREFDKHNSKT